MARTYIGEPCYFCGMPATGAEHAPPECLFSAFECDSVTVPSCDDHNGLKSFDDRTIRNAFLIPLQDIRRRRQYRRRHAAHFSPISADSLKALAAAMPSFEKTKYRAKPRLLGEDDLFRAIGLPDSAYLPELNLDPWMVQITAALVWDAWEDWDPQLDWFKAGAWSPDWFPGADWDVSQIIMEWELNKNAKAYYEGLQYRPGWASLPGRHARPYPPAIYNFGVNIAPDDRVTFKHRFHNAYTWYVPFKGTSRTIAAMTAAFAKAKVN